MKIYAKNGTINPSNEHGKLELIADYIITDIERVNNGIQKNEGCYVTLIESTDIINPETDIDLKKLELHYFKEVFRLGGLNLEAFIMPMHLIQKRAALKDLLGISDVSAHNEWFEYLFSKFDEYKNNIA